MDLDFTDFCSARLKRAKPSPAGIEPRKDHGGIAALVILQQVTTKTQIFWTVFYRPFSLLWEIGYSGGKLARRVLRANRGELLSHPQGWPQQMLLRASTPYFHPARLQTRLRLHGRSLVHCYIGADWPQEPVLWNRNDLLRFRFRFWFRIQTYWEQFSKNKKFVQDLALFNVRSSIFPQKVGLPLLLFILFLLNFILDPDSNPVPLRQKSYGSCGSGSTTLLKALVASFITSIYTLKKGFSQ